MSITIKDIAKKAGVSVVTVSRVFNNTYPSKVSEATRQRVLQIAKDLNYRPNVIARGLRKGKTKLIGVIVPSLMGSFTAETIQGIQDVIEEKDFSTLLYTTDSQPQKTEKFIQLLWEKRVDGMLYFSPLQGHTKLLQRMMEDGIPVVQVLFQHEELDAPYLLVDQQGGGEKATSYLLGLGHRRILHLSAAETDQHGILRHRGFKKVTGAIDGCEAMDLDVGYDWKRAYHLVKQFFLEAKNDHPTAIFASSDRTALGAMKALKEMGINVPRHVSVIGFDNMEISELSSPSLTTMAQPKYDVGLYAMEMLLSCIEGEDVSSRVLDAELIVRESTGPRTP